MAEPQLPECDLVMKGGVTSGLVYQGAVLWLKDHYRFRSIGGASAGAIAAVLTAAAEYGRRGGSDGFAQMRAHTDCLGMEKGLLRSLFQPVPAARPAFDALAALVAGRGAPATRLLRALGRILLEYWGLAAWAAVAVAAYVVAVERTNAASLPVLVTSAVLLAALAAAAVVAAALASAGWTLARALEQNGFGMCPGTRQAGFDGPPLMEWMHGAIQACAGRTRRDPPLTFADLEAREITLRTITTDLAYARPVNLPVPEDFPTRYLFDPDDLRSRIPGEVVRFLERDDVAPPERVAFGDGSQRTLRALPRLQMPIVLAARLSLTFPLLLSTIRLWSIPPGRSYPIEHWFSDGGISSNFPIHFFDAWIPSRPTFGLDLQTRQSEAETEVVLVGSRKTDLPPPARYGRVRSVADFAKQIADAARNWHDATQSELPGFRDRVCHIRLSRDEGGLNLDMDEETIRRLMRRGDQAGKLITDAFWWDGHRFTRYLTLMQMLEHSLRGSAPAYDDLRRPLEAGGLPEATGYTKGHGGKWCADASAATADVIGTAEGWASSAAGGFDQGGGAEPEPAPVMRIVPDI
jgi:predicted acylesterase/phospholipase RssA